MTARRSSPIRLVRLSNRPPEPERILSVRRLLLSLAAGLLAGAAVTLSGLPELALLAGWIVTSSMLLTWVWRMSWPQGHEGTKRLAEAESHTRSTDSAILIASVASLAVVVWALVRFSGEHDVEGVTAVILSVVAVVLSWALVNTVFALKYARLYYLDNDGGIDFGDESPPAYGDFAYMAFTVGMSFAVSDTEPTVTAIRKVALGHALLSYAFGTGILAVAINLVTNLGQN